MTNQPSAQFLTDLFTGWAGWVRKYGTDVIEVRPTFEHNTLMVVIHPEKFPDVERTGEGRKNWEGTTRTWSNAMVKVPRVSLGLALRASLGYWRAFFLRGPLIMLTDELILHIPLPPRKETREQD